GAKESRRVNLRLELLARCVGESTCVGIPLEQRRRHHVDADVGGLCREDRRDEQLERRRIVQLGVSVGMLRLGRVEGAPDLFGRLKWVVPELLFQPTLLYESENTRQCSWSAAMRLGTNCTGTTTFVRTGARTTCSDSASLI